MFINSVALEGRLGKDPEVKQTPTGKQIAKASLAVYAGKNKDGSSKTLWLTLSCWEKMADLLMECKKGDSVVVLGELTDDSYEKNGAKVERLGINVRGFSHASRPQHQETGPKAAPGFDESVPW